MLFLHENLIYFIIRYINKLLNDTENLSFKMEFQVHESMLTNRKLIFPDFKNTYSKKNQITSRNYVPLDPPDVLSGLNFSPE